MTRRIRIGIDTGGTFTDVVAFDEDTGELVTTKTPSTPGNPADGFLAGVDKVLGLLGATGADIDAVTTTAADVLGIQGHRLEVGGNADLVVFGLPSLRRVLALHPEPTYVIASGRLVASSTSTTTWHHKRGATE